MANSWLNSNMFGNLINFICDIKIAKQFFSKGSKTVMVVKY